MTSTNASISWFAAVLTGAMAFLVMPKFESLLKTAGASLPYLTVFVLDYFWAFTLLFAFAGAFLTWKRSESRAVTTALIASGAIAIGLALYGLYQPIQAIGQQVAN